MDKKKKKPELYVTMDEFEEMVQRKLDEAVAGSFHRSYRVALRSMFQTVTKIAKARKK